jgi:hypothetical protein
VAARCLVHLHSEDEIFNKSYNPPERVSKLSEIKTIEVPADFMNNLPFSKRKTKSKRSRTTIRRPRSDQRQPRQPRRMRVPSSNFRCPPPHPEPLQV